MIPAGIQWNHFWQGALPKLPFQGQFILVELSNSRIETGMDWNRIQQNVLFLLSLIIECFVIIEDLSYRVIFVIFVPHGRTDDYYALPLLDMDFVYKDR